MSEGTGQENTHPNLHRLQQFIATHYSRSELRELCYDLDIEYEELGGPETRHGKVREFLLYVGREKKFEQLLEALRAGRNKPFDASELEATSEMAGELYAELASFEEATKPEQQRLLEKIGPRQLIIFASLATLIVASAIALFLALRTPPEDETLPMSGDFNVAVAEFGRLNEDGTVSQSKKGEELSRQVFDTLESAIEELVAADFDIELREPALTGLIGGEDADARASSAEQLANDMNVHLLIYGNLASNRAESVLTPEFYLSGSTLGNAEELSGAYEFGSQVRATGDIEGNPVTSRDLRTLVSERAAALANFVIGLGFFAVDRYDEALEFFSNAEAASGWDRAEGKEVLYLFLGSTAAKRGDMETALTHFETALDENGRYARALLGLGQIYFLQARDDCQPGAVDPDEMQNALDRYQEALSGSHPPLADIPTKAALASARVFLCLSIAETDNKWDAARELYNQVVDEYEDGNDRIRYLAAEALADLGLIEHLLGSQEDTNAYGKAVEYYGDAIGISDQPDRRAIFYLRRADVYIALGQSENALADLDAADQAYDAFQDANPGVRLAEFESSRDTVWSRLEAAEATPVSMVEPADTLQITATPTIVKKLAPATSAPMHTTTPSPQSAAIAATASPTVTEVPHLVTLLQMAIRYGPGTEYDPPLGSLEVGKQVPIVGRNRAFDGLTWWKIACPATIQASECWVSGGPQYTLASNSDGVPEAVAPPTPTPSPTHTATPTLSPTETPSETPGMSPLKRQDAPPAGVAAQLGYFAPELIGCDEDLWPEDFLVPGGVLELGGREVLAEIAVCLADFSAGVPLTVTMSSPSGDFEQMRFETWSEGAGLWTWTPMPGAPLGEVTIIFAQSQHLGTAQLTLQQATRPRARVLTYSGPAGTTFRFALAGFASSQPLYLYRRADDCFCLDFLTVLPPPQIDDRGESIYLLPTEEDDPPGVYAIDALGLSGYPRTEFQVAR